MTPTEQAIADAFREIEQYFGSGRDGNKVKDRTDAFLQRVKEFNSNWDQELRFYTDHFDDWMKEIPAIWIKPLPFPHPAFEQGADENWRMFLAEQRRISGQAAAYLTNAARQENNILHKIVVSRVWLWVALTDDAKVGSDKFWDLVLDEVARQIPDWTVPSGGDVMPPDTKTLRNMISVRAHKRFLKRIKES